MQLTFSYLSFRSSTLLTLHELQHFMNQLSLVSQYLLICQLLLHLGLLFLGLQMNSSNFSHHLLQQLFFTCHYLNPQVLFPSTVYFRFQVQIFFFSSPSVLTDRYLGHSWRSQRFQSFPNFQLQFVRHFHISILRKMVLNSNLGTRYSYFLGHCCLNTGCFYQGQRMIEQLKVDHMNFTFMVLSHKCFRIQKVRHLTDFHHLLFMIASHHQVHPLKSNLTSQIYPNIVVELLSIDPSHSQSKQVMGYY